MANEPILIAGGGIGGLAAALALSRKGRAVHLLEQGAAFTEVGAGLQLGPNVYKMFEVLGLTEAIEEVAVNPAALVMNDALSGEPVTRIPLGEPFEQRFGFPYGVIYRPDLHRILVDACQGSPGIELSLGRKIAGHEQIGAGVRVLAEDGESFEGAALVGADGLWSKVRGRQLRDGSPRVSGHIAYRAVLPMEAVPEALRSDDVILWAGPKTHLVQYPLHRGELLNLVAVFHSDRYEEGWDAFGDPAELHDRFRGEHATVLALLERIESWRMWVLCDREPVRDWSNGRVTLLGDAAHPMLQYLAQGACMAIEDAVCLAHRVERHGTDLASAFQAYEADRYLRTARVQLTARFYGDIYHAAGVTRELRNLLLGGRDPARAYEGMAWLYEGVDATGGQIVP